MQYLLLLYEIKIFVILTFLQEFYMIASIPIELWIPILCSIGALIYGVVSISWILKKSDGNERMREIATAIQQGASAYLNRQYFSCWSRYRWINLVLFRSKYCYWFCHWSV